jgi:hypothetical protein
LQLQLLLFRSLEDAVLSPDGDALALPTAEVFMPDIKPAAADVHAC